MLYRVKLLLVAALIGIGVALTYYVFEAAVSHGLELVWHDWFDTDAKRWLVIPLTVGISLIYFGALHLIDKRNEHREIHGLGGSPKPNLRNFFVVLAVGFFSLLAGASLGPEAILVPACAVLGGYLGANLLHDRSELVQRSSALGFVALCAAFFGSFWTGMLALLLVRKEFKIVVGWRMVLLGAVASLTTVIVLHAIEAESYLSGPIDGWGLHWSAVPWLLVMVAGGYGVTWFYGYAYHALERLIGRYRKSLWWKRALIGGLGIAALYLIGGTLVQFTGNESIRPLFARASELGVLSILGIIVIKLIVMAWSKAADYRGGLIFPMVFVASALVAIARLHTSGLGFYPALIAAMVGVILAERKLKVLT